MPMHVDSRHTIVINAPIERCFMFFTPAGEERWVPGWQPRYVHPTDNSTCAEMVFTTGEGADTTVWLLVDFCRDTHRSRYARITPGNRAGLVDIHCRALDDSCTEVTVRYALTALSDLGSQALENFEGAAFVQMVESWQRDIARRLPQLLATPIP